MAVILLPLDRAQTNMGAGWKLGMGPLEPRMHPPSPPTYLRIFGVTKDGTGTPLAGCTVHLLRTLDDTLADVVVSDGSGSYEFRSASLSTAYYIVAYLPGSPDRAGTTVNSLVGS